MVEGGYEEILLNPTSGTERNANWMPSTSCQVLKAWYFNPKVSKCLLLTPFLPSYLERYASFQSMKIIKAF